MTSLDKCAFCNSTRARRRDLAKQLADMLHGRVRAQMPAGEILQAQQLYAEINQLRAQEATPVCQACYTQATDIMQLQQLRDLPKSDGMLISDEANTQACNDCRKAWNAKNELRLYTMKEMWKRWRDQCKMCVNSPNISPQEKQRYNDTLLLLQQYILKTL